MKAGNIRKHVHRKTSKQPSGCGNLKSFIAILIGILIAVGGMLLPQLFFSHENELLVGKQNTVNVLSSDSVHTVTRDTSFTLEDYAWITLMTQSGSRYYSEPTDAQLSMREASSAAGEILKALLPNVFTGVTTQPYTLSSAILTSNIQSSEEDYDYRQSFWYVDIIYPEDRNDLTVSAAINAVNGKAWSVDITFPMDSSAPDSYGIRVADDILSTWGIPSNIFFTDNSVAESTASVTSVGIYPVNTESMIESGEYAAEGEFYAEYLVDDGVLVYNASDFYDRLRSSVRTVDGMTDFMEYLYEEYLDYLGIPAGDDGQDFSVEIIYGDDLWYSRAIEDCRELISMEDELQDAAAAENYVFAKMYDGDDIDTILLDSDAYEEALFLMYLTEYPYPYELSALLMATEETTGLYVSIYLRVSFEEAFNLEISLGISPGSR